MTPVALTPAAPLYQLPLFMITTQPLQSGPDSLASYITHSFTAALEAQRGVVMPSGEPVQLKDASVNPSSVAYDRFIESH